jgi:hypothetical protein
MSAHGRLAGCFGAIAALASGCGDDGGSAEATSSTGTPATRMPLHDDAGRDTLAAMRRVSLSSPVARVLLALIAGTACRDQADPAPSPATEPPPSSVAASPCDLGALREASTRISERWSSWSPRSGTIPDFSIDAIAAVWAHYPKLPDEAKLMLDLHIDHRGMPSLADIARAEGRPAPAVNDDPLEARLPGHARYHELGKAARSAAFEWRASICPDYAEIEKAWAETRAGHREALLWDRCAYRYDFVTREQFVATGRGMGAVGFALHHWLTESGVDEATADALARAVVLGQLLTGGPWLLELPPGLELPALAAGTEVSDGVLVEVGPKAVRHRGRTLVTLDDTGAILPSRGEWFVGPLYDAMVEEADRGAELAENGGDTWTGTLLLVVHRELPWSTLRPVLATAMRAGFRRAALLGLTDDRFNPLHFVVVHDGPADAEAAAGGTLLELDDATTVQALADAALAREGPVRLLP